MRVQCGLLTQRLARSLSLAPHAVNATRLGVAVWLSHTRPRVCVRARIFLRANRATIHIDCVRQPRRWILTRGYSCHSRGIAAAARTRTRTRTRSRAPYTPRSRSGMNETMISTHDAKVGDSSGGTRCGATRGGAERRVKTSRGLDSRCEFFTAWLHFYTESHWQLTDGHSSR